MGSRFAHFATRASSLAGHYGTFLAAVALIVGWAVTGPSFGFSETWQLVINTGTTIITFLMVFLIQNTQNRDARAMHLKLDELIRAVKEADNALMRAEDESDEDLAVMKERYASLSRAHAELQTRLDQRASEATVASRGGNRPRVHFKGRQHSPQSSGSARVIAFR